MLDRVPFVVESAEWSHLVLELVPVGDRSTEACPVNGCGTTEHIDVQKGHPECQVSCLRQHVLWDLVVRETRLENNAPELCAGCCYKRFRARAP